MQHMTYDLTSTPRKIKAAVKQVLTDNGDGAELGDLGEDQQQGESHQDTDSEKEALKQELASERAAHDDAKVHVLYSRQMAKTYWERWRYELEERKELQRRNMELHFKHQPSKSCSHVHVPRIDRSLLCNSTEFGESPRAEDLFVGRGSFGIVKLQMYHGICVAVKEFLPRTAKESVEREAQLMCELCHPYLPLLFGVCTLNYPYYTSGSVLWH